MRTLKNNFSIVRTILTVIFFLFLFCQEGMSQDILTLKSGKELKVIITEERTDVLKYREFTDQSGPEYSIKRDQIDAIKYGKPPRNTKVEEGIANEKNQSTVTVKEAKDNITEPGLLTVKRRYIYLDGAVQSTRNVKNIMQDNIKALELYEKGAKQCALSNTCAFGVILSGLMVVSMNGKTEDLDVIRRNSITGLVIDGVFITTAVVLVSSGKKNIRSGVDIYNESIRNNKVSYKLDFGIQQNGIGFAMKF